jgi:small subunit ribosomal protein S17
MRKLLVGEITGRSGDKTVRVTYFYKGPHPKYAKEMRRKTVVHAHDGENSCAVGDRVKIMETRPLSRLKRWRVVSVVRKAENS